MAAVPPKVWPKWPNGALLVSWKANWRPRVSTYAQSSRPEDYGIPTSTEKPLLFSGQTKETTWYLWSVIYNFPPSQESYICWFVSCRVPRKYKNPMQCRPQFLYKAHLWLAIVQNWGLEALLNKPRWFDHFVHCCIGFLYWAVWQADEPTVIFPVKGPFVSTCLGLICLNLVWLTCFWVCQLEF